MYYLFLDTETSALSPSQGEIIEIGAVIAEFDNVLLKFKPLESFQSLVKPEIEIENKIEKLTGITNLDLSLAKSKNFVKDNWANWIDKQPKIEAIIGHSIGFDKDFLKAGGWYIPEAKFIDTLDWAKILLPEFYAINLEYIQEKISFSSSDLGLSSNILLNLAPHRALYDTYLCIHVANYLISEFTSLPISTEFSNHFQRNYLQLEFNYYPKLPPVVSTSEEKEGELEFNPVITATGQKSWPNFDDIFNQIGIFEIKKLELLCLQDQGYNLNFLLHQILIISIKKFTLNNYKFKIHAFGDSSYYLNQIVLHSLIKLVPSTKVSVWQNPEKLITLSKQVVYKHLELGKAADLAIILAENVDNQEYKALLKKFNSNHYFLVFHLQNLMQNYEYNLPADSSDLANLNIKKQLQQISEIISELKTHVLNPKNTVIKAINSTFLNLINDLVFKTAQAYKIQNQNGRILILEKKQNFNLHQFIEEIINSNCITTVNTELDKLIWNDLIYSLNIKDLVDKLEVNYAEKNQISIVQQVKLEDLLNYAYNESNETNKVALILAGQNSGLKDSQRVTIEGFNYSQYLILGESGSLTKISSKILSGFKGLVIGKVSNLTYFGNLNKMEVSSVYVINEPYLYIEDGFISKDDRTRLLPVLKLIYIQSISNQVGKTFGCKFIFVRSYNC